MNDAKKQMIADALAGIVEKAKSGGPITRIGLIAFGSELGAEELLEGGRIAQRENPGLKVVAIGPFKEEYKDLEWIHIKECEITFGETLEKALAEGKIQGAVALHYPFPIGVATIGRVVTPGRGKPMFIATTTGAVSSSRNEGLLLNALYGSAAAKAYGIENPTVAYLNLDGAGTALRALTRLKEKGYKVNLGTSIRGDGGSVLRGNDILAGAVDVIVCDTLTGNALMKIFSAYTSGGTYETQGWGYGPSIGDGWKSIISIISRVSGAPVIANALAMTAKMAQGDLVNKVAHELREARRAGLDDELKALAPKATAQAEEVKKPPAVPVDEEIAGVDVMEMDNAAQTLWKENIYAETAMGCTGPVVRVQTSDLEKAKEILKASGFI